MAKTDFARQGLQRGTTGLWRGRSRLRHACEALWRVWHERPGKALQPGHICRRDQAANFRKSGREARQHVACGASKPIDADAHAPLYAPDKRFQQENRSAYPCAVALFRVLQFRRIHKTLRMSPGMAAGISDRLWSMEDIVALIDAREGEPKKRGPYKKRVVAA